MSGSIFLSPFGEPCATGNGDAKLHLYPAHHIAANQMRLNIGTSQQANDNDETNDEIRQDTHILCSGRDTEVG